MNSKKRNKKRQNKPPNPTPPQKQEGCEPSNPPDVINTEIGSVVEERVPNIVCENAPAEIKETEDSPKKPKRNRGKKKKDDDRREKGDEVKNEELVLEAEVQPIKESSDEANIAPTVRKNKNTNKKGQGSVQVEKVEEIKIEKDVQNTEIISQTPEDLIIVEEEPEQETKSGKKKNKKKKNRNDSERSDKAEEISCTSAFQKLLSEDVKIENVVQPSTDESSVSEATIKEVEIASQSITPADNILKETQDNYEGNKNKKKNKKDRKPQTGFDIVQHQEQIKSQEIISTENLDIPSNVSGFTIEATVKENPEVHKVDETIPSTSVENTFKNKAKISKSAEIKKKNGKCNENVEKTKEAKFENVEEGKKVEATQIEPKETTIIDVSPTEDLDDIILVPLTEITPDWQEEVKLEEGNGPVIGCEDKHETITPEQPCQSHEKNKKIKKSPKPSRKTETPVLSDDTNIVSEFEASSSSVEVKPLEPEVKVEIKQDKKMENQETLVKNIDTIDDNKQKDIKKKSPTPSTDIERVLGIQCPSTTLSTMPKSDEVSEDISSQLTEPVEFTSERDQEAKMQVSDNADINIRSKSPNLSSKNKKAMSCAIPEDIVQHPLALDGAIMPPPIKAEDIPEIQLENKNTEKSETERVNTPDSLKRQKRKKSPKPVDISIASCSQSTQKSKQQVLNIDDIIIIQAEVVSEEKAKEKGDLLIASRDKLECEKSKKRKKSPKPLQKGSTQEMLHGTEGRKECELETQGEIQMPATPKPQDVKLLPETVAIELDTPKIDSLPSPSEVTPDFIEQPRCSSEQLDTNNNTVIQEIQCPDPNLSVPITIPETPFIQSTAMSSPELPSGIRVIGLESDNKPIEEKTDLKSKVLEVNQDMEELRMSIEKSLAELTSLEKSDKDTEKYMEKQNTVIDEKTESSIDAQQEVLIAEQRPALDQTVDMLVENKQDFKHTETEATTYQAPVCPARKDRKGKGKSKKKGKQESTSQSTSSQSSTNTTGTEISSLPQNKSKDDNKSAQSSANTQEKEKQQNSKTKQNNDDDLGVCESNEKNNQLEFVPIENFEDAMTSSIEDVNKTFEIIAKEAESRLTEIQNNPEINVIAPQEDDKSSRQEKQNPVSQPKNLLGHPDIPVLSSRTDYKKEKNKPPNCRQAKVRIKDTNQVEIEIPEKSKEAQTESKTNLLNFKKPDASICVTNQNEDYIYKYSFRKVFLQCTCHVCKKDLNRTRVPCSYCNLIFYCNQKHKDEDYSQHQALCFAVSTIVHLKDQKFIYGDSRNVTGHNYRLLRMQMIVSCEKVLKRRLAPWEQEALLYPRMCALTSCREWRQGKLVDCEGCGQISYCSEHPDHLPKSHSRWCKSYNLYRGLVKHQQTKGRLEPKLPTRVLELIPLPENINEVLAAMYEEKIEMSDIEYAALTQLATAPLTALFCLQHSPNAANGKKALTLHIVGAELQFEADVLNKWEVFLLHLLPNVEELKVVLVGPDLNPSNLPLNLLGKIRYCENCQRKKRRVVFGFQDKRTYHEFWASEDFTAPDLVCAFNPSIQRSSSYNGKDAWPATINCILKLKSPLAITSYTISELTSDLLRVQECATVRYNILCAPKNNSFASVRPDRNFISDDEAPLLFKNHCVTVVCGV